jgi:hypothetical protein
MVATTFSATGESKRFSTINPSSISEQALSGNNDFQLEVM